MNGVANLQGRNIHRDPVRQVTGKTFYRQRAQTLLEQAAKILHAIRHTKRLERDFRMDSIVHRDGMKIDMEHRAAQRRMLDFLHQGGAIRFFTGDLELD